MLGTIKRFAEDSLNASELQFGKGDSLADVIVQAECKSMAFICSHLLPHFILLHGVPPSHVGGVATEV